MSPIEIYPWLKALHVAAALTFIGGLLAVSVFLAAVPDGDAGRADMARSIRHWDRRVTTPALLSVWPFGLTLAITGGWFVDIWLQTKLMLVLILSGLHGVQSGRLRRLAAGGETRPLRLAPVATACTIAIALLAVVKPF